MFKKKKNNLQEKFYKKYIISLKKICINDIKNVGYKNAFLGEIINKFNIFIPRSYTTTLYAFQKFFNQKIEKNITLNEKILFFLENINIKSIFTIKIISYKIRKFILNTFFPNKFKKNINIFYKKIIKKTNNKISFAIKTSNIYKYSFKNFFTSKKIFLNIKGIKNLLKAIKIIFSSLYNNKTILYKINSQNINNYFLCVCIQQMVHSDISCTGNAHTISTKSKFEDIIYIISNYDLKINIIKNLIKPDKFYIHKTSLKRKKFSIIKRSIGNKLFKIKFKKNSNVIYDTIKIKKIKKINNIRKDNYFLTNNEIIKIAKIILKIEEYYKCQIHIKWAKNVINNQIYILQIKPKKNILEKNYNNLEKKIKFKKNIKILTQGKAIGKNIAFGKICIVKHLLDINFIKYGNILITNIINLNWKLILKKVSGIIIFNFKKKKIPNIIQKKNIPIIINYNNFKNIFKKNDIITITCLKNEKGKVYDGLLNIKFIKSRKKKILDIPFNLIINIKNPKMIFEYQKIPNNGINLINLKFIINNFIKIHPRIIFKYPNINIKLKKAIDFLTKDYISPKKYYIEKLIENISILAATFWPKPIFICFSNFKFNEYKKLIGGLEFNKKKLLSFKKKYNNFWYSFILECKAINKIKNKMGLTNLQILIPNIKKKKKINKIFELLNLNNLEKLNIIYKIYSSILLKNFFFNKFNGFFINFNNLIQLIYKCKLNKINISTFFLNSNEKKKIFKIIKIFKDKNMYINNKNFLKNIYFIKLFKKKNIFILLNINFVIKICHIF